MRGCSYYYSKIQAKRFLKDNKVKMIIRGHEVQINGYNYQKSNSDEKLTLTIFSAPNYCDTYKNKGAVAFVADVNFHLFRTKSQFIDLVMLNIHLYCRITWMALSLPYLGSVSSLEKYLCTCSETIESPVEFHLW